MPTQTLTAKLVKKASNGKGFVLEGQEGWFNASDKSEPFLAKIEVGKVVEVSYFKKGVKREVTMIKIVDGVKESPTETSEDIKEENGTYTNCAICGKELKGKGVNYPNCWDCKDKAPKKEKKETTTVEPKEKRTYTPYNSDDRTAQIQRGNAANCAGMAVGGNFAGNDPQTIAEAVKVIADQVLDWLRAE